MGPGIGGVVKPLDAPFQGEYTEAKKRPDHLGVLLRYGITQGVLRDWGFFLAGVSSTMLLGNPANLKKQVLIR